MAGVITLARGQGWAESGALADSEAAQRLVLPNRRLCCRNHLATHPTAHPTVKKRKLKPQAPPRASDGGEPSHAGIRVLQRPGDATQAGGGPQAIGVEPLLGAFDAVRERHEAMGAKAFNNDTTYKTGINQVTGVVVLVLWGGGAPGDAQTPLPDLKGGKAKGFDARGGMGGVEGAWGGLGSEVGDGWWRLGS